MTLRGRPTNPRGRATKVSGEHAALFGKSKRKVSKTRKTKKNKKVNRHCVNCGLVIPLKTPYVETEDGRRAHFICP